VKVRPYRIAAVVAGLSLVMGMFGAWLLDVSLPWVLVGGAIVGLVLVRLFGRSTPTRGDS
jgi:hypothetical protein